MSRRELDLSALSWQFGQVPRQPFGPAPVDDRGQVSRWLPARVPGDVRADLISAGLIPSVDSPDGILAGAWVDDSDWWYRTTLPGGRPREEALILEADGIDYHSAIWLDGRMLATHSGMFARQTVLLSPGLVPPGPHELAIRIWGGGALTRTRPLARRVLGWLAGKLRPGTQYFSDRMATPKAQYSFGWDFAPRLLSAGIWDEIRLVTARGAYVQDMWAYGEPLTETEDPTPARWQIVLRVMRWQPSPVRVEITVQPEDFADAGYQTLSRTVELCSEGEFPCTSDYEFQLDIGAARRWWPWDQGEPCLYRVTVRLHDQAGVLDEISQVAGVRSVRRAPLPGGAPWRFVLNGRPLFLRGANWVPADVLPGRVSDETYQDLLTRARAAGVNFLRVWGGGLREKRGFWERCDRLGLMAWQEFPLACDFFDAYSQSPEYLQVLASEATGMVRSLRNHPSLIAWCGGNEIDVTRERSVLRQISQVVSHHDPTRPWIPASPAEGDVHQWDVWHRFSSWTGLARTSEPFMSEFGLQALPDPATLAEMFPFDVPTALSDRRWSQRKAEVAKLLHYGGPDARGDLESATRATQRAQATALQAGLEACRINRETCGGVAFWQFNEPWPAVSWSVVDHAGRAKAAYDMLRRSYQPLLLAARFSWRRYESGDIFDPQFWIVNDGPEAWQDCVATATLDGELIWTHAEVDIDPASVRHLGGATCSLSASPGVLTLKLSRNGLVLATNQYDLKVFLPPSPPWPRRFLRRLAGYVPK